MANDYISVQEAIEKINERARETFILALGYEFYLGALHDVADDLRQIPTVDAEPIVRCKDCEYRSFYGGNAHCYLDGRDTKDEDFCSWGERKDDENLRKL